MTNDIIMVVSASNFQGNRYKEMYEQYLGPFCDVWYQEKFKRIFEEIHEHVTNRPAWKTCPYPRGKYRINNYLFADKDNFLPPYIPGNEKWKISMRFSRGSEVLGGYNIFGMLRNEQSMLKLG